MKTAQLNDKVTVTFTGTTEDGQLFDEATVDRPLCFELGDEEVNRAFSEAICGMQEGESRQFILEAEKGFGARLEDLVQTFDKEKFDTKTELKPGMVLSMTVEKEGVQHQVPAMVTEVNDRQVTIDYNHPLAGKALRYKVTLIKIEGDSQQV